MSDNPEITEGKACSSGNLSISVIAKIFENLGKRRKVTRTMWARRSQEYEAKIKSGNLMVIASVVHDLYPRSKMTDSIFTEWKIYEAALEALVACVASINKCSENKTRRLIKKYLEF